MNTRIQEIESRLESLETEKKALLKELIQEKLNNTDYGKKAKELYFQGFRIENWGITLENGGEISLRKDGRIIDSWSSTSNNDIESLFDVLGLKDDAFGNDVVETLNHLSRFIVLSRS
jgi:hypothetical protein